MQETMVYLYYDQNQFIILYTVDKSTTGSEHASDDPISFCEVFRMKGDIV